MSEEKTEVLIPVFVMMTPTHEILMLGGNEVRRWRGLLLPTAGVVDVYVAGVGASDPRSQAVVDMLLKQKPVPPGGGPIG